MKKLINTHRTGLARFSWILATFVATASVAVGQVRVRDDGFFYPTPKGMDNVYKNNWMAAGSSEYFANCYHTGCDFAKSMPQGERVFSIGEGKVANVYQYKFDSGKYKGRLDPDRCWVWISYKAYEPGTGREIPFMALYGHIETLLQKNQTVMGGDYIGKVLDYNISGNRDQPGYVDHLHFGINLAGEVSDRRTLSFDYIDAKGVRRATAASIGWGLGQFTPSMPGNWMTKAAQNKDLAEKRGFVDPVWFLQNRLAVFRSGTGPATTTLFRYYNRRNGDHFYTTVFAELENGRGDYVREGDQGRVFSGQGQNVVRVYRYYNGSSGQHFYTTNFDEVGNGRYGYSLESGTFFVFPRDPNPSNGARIAEPMYRYVNDSFGGHFYTLNFNELGYGQGSWRYEGVAWWQPKS